jgi:hypothetical protein
LQQQTVDDEPLKTFLSSLARLTGDFDSWRRDKLEEGTSGDDQYHP